MLTPEQISKTLREKGHKYLKAIGAPFAGDAVCLIGLLCREYLDVDTLTYLLQFKSNIGITNYCIEALEGAGYSLRYLVVAKTRPYGSEDDGVRKIWLDGYLWLISDVTGRTWDEMADMIDQLEVYEPVA